MSALDYVVLAAYFAVIIAAGVYFSRGRITTARQYFLGDRKLPVWAVACSVVATALSAATFVGTPQLAYTGDLTFLSTNIGTVLAVFLVAAIFIPAFYRHNVMTVYELLEIRMGRPAKQAASAMFMIGRVLASGARLYIAAIPAALVAFGDVSPGHLLAAIVVLTLVGTFYTLIGGIRSIIWTDVLQLMVLGGTAVAAVVFLWWRIPASTAQVLDALRHPVTGGDSKLTLLTLGVGSTGIAWGKEFTLLTALTGFLLFGVAAYGTDQDLAQRVLTCRSSLRGSMSAVSAILLSLPVTLVLMLAGLLLYVFYQRPDLMGVFAPRSPPAQSAKVFVAFVLDEMPAGLRGLFLAGLFAVALGSFNSVLNAMSSTLVADFYRQWRPARPERHYVQVGRACMAMWGLILGAFACSCVYWHNASDPRSEKLINFALSVMNFAYSGLLAVFLTALFTRRGSSASVIAALVTGFLVVLALEMRLWQYGPAGWDNFQLAFPWRMVAATALAFFVSLLGRPTQPLSTQAGSAAHDFEVVREKRP